MKLKTKKKGFRDQIVEVPDDLGVRIGTEEQSIWEMSKSETKKVIADLEKALIINKGILELCDQKIEAEKLK